VSKLATFGANKKVEHPSVLADRQPDRAVLVSRQNGCRNFLDNGEAQACQERKLEY